MCFYFFETRKQPLHDDRSVLVQQFIAYKRLAISTDFLRTVCSVGSWCAPRHFACMVEYVVAGLLATLARVGQGQELDRCAFPQVHSHLRFPFEEGIK